MKAIRVPYDSDKQLSKLKRLPGIISASVGLVNIKYPESYTGYKPNAYKEILVFFDEDQLSEAKILSIAGRGSNPIRNQKRFNNQ